MTPSADTRTQIMDAFAEQLAVSGYPGISLVGVARTAGIQKPSLYHHFRDGKEEIYCEVALRFIADLSERIAASLASAGTFEERLAGLAAVSADHTPGSLSFEQRIYDTLGLVSEETSVRVSQRYVDGVLSPVVELFTAAVEAGEVHGDPEFLVNSFLHLARGTGQDQVPEAARRVVALFMDGARAGR